MVIAGVVLISLAGRSDPEADFEKLDEKCKVINFEENRYEEQTNNNNNNGGRSRSRTVCKAKFVYMFCGPGDSDSAKCNYKSKESIKDVCDDFCDSCFNKVDPDFEVNEETVCWKPATKDVPELYQCGNSECLKIFNPADDILVVFVAGGIVLGIGICFALCYGVAFGVLNQQWKAAMRQQAVMPLAV